MSDPTPTGDEKQPARGPEPTIEPPATAPPTGGESEPAQAAPRGRKSPRPPADDNAPARPQQPRPTVIVRYGLMRTVGEFRHNLDPPPDRGTHVVVRTERGVELGEVITPVAEASSVGCISKQQLKQFAEANGPDYPFRRDGKVLRLANPQDVIDYRHLEGSAREAAAYCRQQIAELGLEMKLVTVEHLLGGERIIFYFSAEHRVDFRELVRRLAAQYRTRIEMRQVGARDEARLVADYERCGQQCCCQRFLRDLKPVSMRMAKTQKATLDPSKISGRCGRLMCCLRYEDTTYEELRSRLPKRNTWVRTASKSVGRVVDTQILTQLVQLQLPDGSRTVVANEDIVEQGVEPPPPKAEEAVRPPKPKPSRQRRAAQPEPQPAPEPAAAPAAPAAPEAAPTDESSPEDGQDKPPPRRKRRRGGRGRRKKAGAEAPPPQPGQASPQEPMQGPPPPAGAQQPAAESRSGAPPRKRTPRRRRGRRKRKK